MGWLRMKSHEIEMKTRDTPIVIYISLQSLRGYFNQTATVYRRCNSSKSDLLLICFVFCSSWKYTHTDTWMMRVCVDVWLWLRQKYVIALYASGL